MGSALAASPVVDFEANVVCEGDKTIFTNNSYALIGDIVLVVWDFGDGNSSNVFSPEYTYSNDGNYLVKLTVMDENGDFDIIQKTVSVLSTPEVSFFESDSQPCQNEQVDFFSTTTNASSYTWNIEGQEYFTENISHSFDIEGEHTVYLKASNTNCSAEISRIINVTGLPEVNFSFENSCSGKQVEFINETKGFVDGMEFYWDFGDSHFSQQLNPKHSYQSDGNYSVTLQIENQKGCSGQAQKEVTIYPVPVASFDVLDICLGDTLFTTNQSIGANEFIWDFGDGTNYVQENPYHIYNNSGDFKVRLNVKSEKGCKDSIEKYVRIYSNPIALFYVPREVCVGEEVVFENFSSAESILKYAWDFGDSFNSIAKTPNHIYSSEGDFTINLSVETEAGCSDTANRKIKNIEQPKPGYILGDQFYCYSDIDKWITIKQYHGEIENWEYSLNDGDFQVISSHLDSLKLDQFDVGKYKFRAKVSNGICDEVLTDPFEVEIIQKSNAGKITGLTEICSGSPITLALTDYFGDIIWCRRKSSNVLWNEISGERNKVLKTSVSENYEFIAIAKNGLCNSDTSDIHKIKVYENPSAGFITGADAICQGGNVQLNIVGNSGNEIIWGKADNPGGPWITLSDKSEKISIHNLKENTFLRAVVGNGYCERDTTNIFEITINEPSKSGMIIGPMTSCEGKIDQDFSVEGHTGDDIIWEESDGSNTFNKIGEGISLSIDSIQRDLQLRAIVINGSCFPDTTAVHDVSYHYKPDVSFSADTVCFGEVTSLISTSNLLNKGDTNFRWSYNGEILSEQESFKYSFPNSSNPLTLTVDNGTCSNSITQLVHLYDLPEGEIFTGNGCHGDSVRVYFASQDSLSELLWSYHDKSISNKPEFFHVFQNPGEKSLKLEVITSEGCKGYFEEKVNIYGLPEISMELPSLYCEGDTAYLSLNQDKNYINEWYIEGYGNFLGSEIQVPLNNPGTFNVHLVSSGVNNCFTQLRDSLVVSKNPESLFFVENICLDSLARFKNKSQGKGLDFEWDFGDGITSEEYSPDYLYKSTGKFLVKLEVTNKSGCTDQFTDEVNVFRPYKSNFSINDICLDKNLPIELDFDTTLIKKAFWNFGDHTIVEGFKPVHHYKTPGSYKIVLETVDKNDCISRSDKWAIVHTIPKVNFDFQNVCLGDTIEFENDSEDENSYLWDFGDGEGSTLKNPTKTYWNYGIYQVSLTVVSPKGCRNNISKPVQIYKLPMADFSVDPVCQGEISTFINLSESTTNHSFHWQIDSVTSTSENPRLYLNEGVYKVQLNVKDVNGCEDSLYRFHFVHENPVVDIEQDEITISKGEEILLSASGASKYSWEPVEYLSNTTTANPLSKPLDTITYFVLGVNQNGCKSIDSVKINVLEDYRVVAGNVFTPDGNGYNDTWKIANLESYQPVQVEVIDRNGRIVYESGDYKNDWSGTYNGNLLPDGTYYYSIHLGDSGVKYAGAITIIRGQ